MVVLPSKKQLSLLGFLLAVCSVDSFSTPRPSPLFSSKHALNTHSSLKPKKAGSHWSHLLPNLSESRRRDTFLPAEAGSSDSAEDNSTENRKAEETTKIVRFRRNIGRYFRSSDKDDGLTTKQRLAKMGLATVLSYGWISNTNAMILLSAAWYVFCVRTGMSPLFPGQWKKFLGVYAGFYVVSNFLRPFRVALAVAVGPYFDRFVLYIERKTGLPKAVSIFATVFIVNFIGTLALMVGLISLASLVSGVPIFPPK